MNRRAPEASGPQEAGRGIQFREPPIFERGSPGRFGASLPPLDQPVPVDFNHLHFGGGQTEAQITLPPGEHTLQLLLADDAHMPHDPPIYSKPITVTVSSSGRRPVAILMRKKHRKHWVYYE